MAPQNDLGKTSPRQFLPKSGEDEDNMQGFIRHHMVSILHPVNEHVREVQTEVQKLAKDLNLANGKADNGRATLDQHGQDLVALRDSLAQTNARLDKTQTELSMTKKEKHRLETDHEVTKAALKKVEERFSQVQPSMDVLRQNIHDLDGFIQRIQNGLSKTDRILVEQGEGLAHNKDMLEALNVWNRDMVKDLGSLGRAGAATDRNVKSLAANFEQQKEEDSHHYRTLTGRIDALEITVGSTTRALQAQENALKCADADIHDLRSGLANDGGKIGKIDTLQTQHLNIAQTLKGHIDHLDRLADGVAELKRDLLEEKNHTLDFKHDLEGRVKINTSNIDDLKQTQHEHIGHIQKADRCIEQLQEGVEKLEAQADTTQNEVKSLVTWQHIAIGKLDLHKVEIQNLQNDLHDMGREHDATNSDLQGLKNDLGNTNSNITKLGTRCDVHNRTMDGLSKGIKDTFRHVVAGEHGLLPPKTLPGMPLPAIPRPPSAQAVRPPPKTIFPSAQQNPNGAERHAAWT